MLGLAHQILTAATSGRFAWRKKIKAPHLLLTPAAFSHTTKKRPRHFIFPENLRQALITISLDDVRCHNRTTIRLFQFFLLIMIMAHKSVVCAPRRHVP